jgi:hypothetical protein
MRVVERRVLISNRDRRSGKASCLQSLLREFEPNESGDAEVIARPRAFDTLDHCASRDARWSAVSMQQ